MDNNIIDITNKINTIKMVNAGKVLDQAIINAIDEIELIYVAGLLANRLGEVLRHFEENDKLWEVLQSIIEQRYRD
jgi:hypothetical protein